jgi:hypothetical protein
MDTREFREAGHKVVDRLADLLEDVEERPLFREVDPSALQKSFDEPLPREGRPIADVLAEIDEKLIPYCTHVNHPGYMGLITPSPLPAGILGDLIASALNQNVGTWSVGPSAVAMERQTVRWLTDLAGLGPAAGGNLTSGGMMANFLGLKLARDWASGDRAQHEGLGGSPSGPRSSAGGNRMPGARSAERRLLHPLPVKLNRRHLDRVHVRGAARLQTKRPTPWGSAARSSGSFRRTIASGSASICSRRRSRPTAAPACGRCA